MELHEVELRLETVSVELEALAKIISEIDQKAQALLESIKKDV